MCRDPRDDPHGSLKLVAIPKALCAGRAHFEQRFLVWNNKS